MSSSYEDLLLNNDAWVASQLGKDPDTFDVLSKGQQPSCLYIGCSDSRVPVEVVTQADPGDIFVHRNIANQVSLSDGNVMSILEYAVLVLKVQHIIVCGHTRCGGVGAALSDNVTGAVGEWIKPIRETYLSNRSDIEEQSSQDDRVKRLSELTVLEQVRTLSSMELVQSAVPSLQIHGWIFEIESGLIRSL